MAKKEQVPAIRFQGFADPWEQRKLSDLAEIVGGGTPDTNNSAYWDGDIDWYAPAEMEGQRYAKGSVRKITELGLQKSSAKILPAHRTVLFTSRAGIGKMAILQRPAATNQGFQSLVLKDGTDPYFIYSMGERIKGMAEGVASGSTFLEISGKMLGNLEVMVPNLKEQESIATFFRGIDDLITLHQRKYDKLVAIKRSMLEKMFPREGSRFPEIRFAGFTDPWEQRKLNSIAEEITRTDPESTAPVMMITANNGFIEQSDRYAFNNAGESLKKYILLEKGEMAYNHGASKLRPYGSCFALTTAESARIPFVYHCFSVGENDSEFVSMELNGARVENQLRRIVSSGARMDGLLNISYEEYSSVKLMMPSVPEQKKLAGYFRQLDTLITLHQREESCAASFSNGCN